MSLNSTPSGNRIHIGIFGQRNVGKSSLINSLTNQKISIVSDIAGTTTDPVYKAMELLPLGPVMLIDTPGLDDSGKLGQMRVQKAFQVLNKTDIAVIVCDGLNGISEQDRLIEEKCKQKKIPYIFVMNKLDLTNEQVYSEENVIWVSSKTGENISLLKEKIAQIVPNKDNRKLVSDLISPSDFVVLVVHIDESAPKGRLILPQQQTLRDIIDAGAVSIVVNEHELHDTLISLGKKPKLVITDSQIFEKVSQDTPDDIMLTSFSILFARYKGNLALAVKGVVAIESLNSGDSVLISEGCTHHRQCDDIGTVKIPKWISDYTKKDINFEFTSATEFPDDLSKYKMVIHCGGCMLNDREMKYRAKCAEDQDIPFTNYGIIIAYIKGILKRSIAPFADISSILK